MIDEFVKIIDWGGYDYNVQVEALAPFAHVQAAELGAAAGALVAINVTLGSNSTSNWAKLLKIVPGVPR